MKTIIYLIVSFLYVGNTYGSDDLKHFENLINAWGDRIQIQSIDKNDKMIKENYYPYMILNREPMIIYVNRSKWNLKINNFKEFVAESRKKEFLYGAINEKDNYYFSAMYLKSNLDLKIKFKYKNKDYEDHFLDEIDVLVAGISYAKNSRLKPIASLTNKRFQFIKYKFPLNQSVGYIAPTIGETDKKGIEYTVPYLIYLKANISQKEKEEIESKLREARLVSKESGEHLYGSDLTRFIENYKKRNLSLEN